MGTRSDIIVQLRDGNWSRIYCHWDGYLEHNGRLLQAHYNSQLLAELLIEPGSLSSLAESCDKPDGHTFDNRVDGYCVYYGRDRGEADCEPYVADTLSAAWPPEDTWTEYTYVWSRDHGMPDGAWYVADADESSQTLVLLSLALAGVAEPKPAIKAFGIPIAARP